MVGMDSPLGGNDLLVDRRELDRETLKAGAGIGRPAVVVRIGDHGEQRLDVRQVGSGEYFLQKRTLPPRGEMDQFVRGWRGWR